MSDLAIEKMRIYELRNKLKEIGLSGSGTKAELITRLTEYYAEQKEKNTNQELQDKTPAIPSKETEGPFFDLE